MRTSSKWVVLNSLLPKLFCSIRNLTLFGYQTKLRIFENLSNIGDFFDLFHALMANRFEFKAKLFIARNSGQLAVIILTNDFL